MARMIVKDAVVLAANIDAALIGLANAQGGYPSSTPGAAPSTAPTPEGERQHLTQPERGALQADPATRDRDMLTRLVRRLCHDLSAAADLAVRLSNPASNHTTVAERTADDHVWCLNCRLHGFENVNRPGRRLCRYCEDFKGRWQTLPTRPIIDYHTRHGGELAQFVQRTLDETAPGWRTLFQTKPNKRRKKR